MSVFQSLPNLERNI
nr:unnamed protein product [Callosobruchus analis]CAI5850803.1 unnamed protein product [Callosobruchus analis]